MTIGTLLVVSLLCLSHAAAGDVVRGTFFFDLPGCRCNVNKPANSMRYLDQSLTRARIQRWDSHVSDIRVQKWVSNAEVKQFHMNTSARSNFTCASKVRFGRDVDYKISVTMPIFLRPFVSDRVVDQHKRMLVVNCEEYEGFVFEEDCLITNLPIIPSIRLTVKSVAAPSAGPVAEVEVEHDALPWYMSMVESQLQGEILDRARRLWVITVKDVCGCG